MAQQDTTRVVREVIEAFNANDMQRIQANQAQVLVYEEFATQRRIQGRDGVVEAFQAWRQAFPDAKGTIRNWFTTGSTMVAEITWERAHRGALPVPGGTIPPSGKRVTVPATEVFTLQGVRPRKHATTLTL